MVLKGFGSPKGSPGVVCWVEKVIVARRRECMLPKSVCH